MADTKQTNVIELIWKSIDQTSDVLNAMGKSTSQFGDHLSKVTGPAANLTTGLLKVEAGALALALALGGFAVNEAGKFDASMRELSSLIAGGEEGAKAFGAALAEMGQRSLVSLEDLTGAMYKAVSQTGSLEEAQKLVTVSEKLAIAGRANLTDTTLLLAGSLDAYGKNMDSAGKFSDILFSIVQGGQTTLTELTNGLGGLAPTANSLGVSFEALGAAVATTTKNAIPTSEAISGLKAVLSNILKPSKDAQAAAADLGIDFSIAGLKSKGFAGFMVEVAEKTHGSADRMGELFGSMEAFNIVMSLASAGGSKFTAMLKNIENSTGATQQAYDLMAKTFGAGNQVILNNLKLVAIAFSSQLLEPVRHVQEAITNFFIKIQDAAKAGVFDEFFKSAKISIEAFVKSLETALLNLPAAFAKVDFGPLKEQIKLLGEAFGSIGGNIDLTTVDGLAKALQLVTDGITQFVALNRGMIEVLPKVFTALSSIAGILLSIDPSWLALTGTILLSLTAINSVGGAFTVLMATMGGMGAAATGLGVALGGLEVALGTIAVAAPLATAALVALTAAGGFWVGSVLSDWIVAQDKAIDGFLGVDETLSHLTHNVIPPAIMSTRAHAKAVTDWSFDIDTSIKSLGGFNVALDTYNTALGLATGKQAEAGASAQGLSKEAQALADAFARAGQKAGNAAELAVAGFSATTIEVRNVHGELVKIPDVYINVGNAAAEAAETMETALEKSVKATQEARDKAEEFRLEWAKLESQERQMVFQLSAEIQVAKIEAESQKVIAAFESINTTITSTGELIGKLAESFLGVSSGKAFDKLLIESMLKTEMEQRKKALELQERLVTSQVNYLNASVERLKSGDALITIKGDGLAPELSAFMFKILETIQIEADANGSAFLLGLPNV